MHRVLIIERAQQKESKLKEDIVVIILSLIIYSMIGAFWDPAMAAAVRIG